MPNITFLGVNEVALWVAVSISLVFVAVTNSSRLWDLWGHSDNLRTFVVGFLCSDRLVAAFRGGLRSVVVVFPSLRE